MSKRRFYRRFLPDLKSIQQNRHLQRLGPNLSAPNLWYLNRHSVIRAVTIALFVCYLPVPGHMLYASLLSILFKANLPVAIATVWVSNPLTMPLMYFIAYEVGIAVLQLPRQPFHFEPSFHWLFAEIDHIMLPILVGALICGALLALLGNLATRLYWRCRINQRWRGRAIR